MGAKAKQAGPGLDRETSYPVVLEAAGPASPRLIIEAVSTRLGTEDTEVSTTLVLGQHRFIGSAVARAGERQVWELAAAASVAAIQHYLQHVSPGPSTPGIQLVEVIRFTTGIAQEAIAATIRVTYDTDQADLHGSALVHNDRYRAAVAAALDAVSRYLGRFINDKTSSRNLGSAHSDEDEKVIPRHPVNRSTLVTVTSLQGEEEVFDSGSRSSTTAVPLPRTPDPAPPDALDSPIAFSNPQPSPAGFPSIGLVISPPGLHAAAINARGAVIAEARRPIRAEAAPEAALTLALQAIREVVTSVNGGVQITSVGVAVPGRFFEDLTGIEGLSLQSQAADLFEEQLSLPISFISPLHAAAYAECSFGAARDISDLLYVRVGVGIAAALILDGCPTMTQLAAERAGHLVIEAGGDRCSCGESGCWQALAGTDALVRRAMKGIHNGIASALSEIDNPPAAITPSLIVRMAATGDPLARRALEETGNYLGLGLANLIALFGPQAVIVESQPAVIGAALLRAAETALKSRPRAGLLSRCVLLSPELGESSAIIGAAAWAARRGG